MEILASGRFPLALLLAGFLWWKSLQLAGFLLWKPSLRTSFLLWKSLLRTSVLLWKSLLRAGFLLVEILASSQFFLILPLTIRLCWNVMYCFTASVTKFPPFFWRGTATARGVHILFLLSSLPASVATCIATFCIFTSCLKSNLFFASSWLFKLPTKIIAKTKVSNRNVKTPVCSMLY